MQITVADIRDACAVLDREIKNLMSGYGNMEPERAYRLQAVRDVLYAYLPEAQPVKISLAVR